MNGFRIHQKDAVAAMRRTDMFILERAGVVKRIDGGLIQPIVMVEGVGDGVTDNQEAIDDALTALSVLGRGTVLFSVGDFFHSSEIAPATGIEIAGMGVGVTIIRCAADVMTAVRFGYKGEHAGGLDGFDVPSDPVHNNRISNLTVARADGAVPEGCAGIAWEAFNYGSEHNVLVSRHYYGRTFEGGINGISIGYHGVNCQAMNCTRAYLSLKGVAGVVFTAPDFGRNGREDFDPVYCVEISGDANDINFTDARMQPHGPALTPVDVFGFIGATNATGIFTLTNFNTEQTRYGFVSDADTPVLANLKITGGRWAIASDLFHLDAATVLAYFALTGGTDMSGNLNLSPNTAARVTGCYFGGPVTLTGLGLILSDLVFTGNHCHGDLGVTGAWKKLRGADPEHNTVLGAYANTATGDTQENRRSFLKTVANIALTSATATAVFTVPAGKTFVCTGAYFVLDTVTSYNNSVAPAFIVDSGEGTDQLAISGTIDPNAFKFVGRTARMLTFPNGAGGVALDGTNVRFLVTAANTSGALLGTVFVEGFYR
jgi:hypothetical protein